MTVWRVAADELQLGSWGRWLWRAQNEPRRKELLLILVSLILASLALLSSGCSEKEAIQWQPESGEEAAPQAAAAKPAVVEEASGPRLKALGRAGHEPDVLRVAVVSDLNGSYGSMSYGGDVHRAVDRLQQLEPDLVLCSGDMVAGQKPGLDYQGMWAAFHRAVTDPLHEAAIPFAPAPGNHDASGFPQHAHERLEYARAWQGRKPALNFVDDSAFPLRYAFVAGEALFIAADITVPGPQDPSQMQWLDQVLTANSGYKTKIVFGHLPLWGFAAGKDGETIRDPAFEDLLKRHQVTVYASGHHQSYYPGRRGDLWLLGTGCLGGGVRPLRGTLQPSYKTILWLEIDPYGLRRVDAFKGPDFVEVVSRESLPRHVGWGESRIDRDDQGPYLERLEAAAQAQSMAQIAGVQRRPKATKPPILSEYESKSAPQAKHNPLNDGLPSASDWGIGLTPKDSLTTGKALGSRGRKRPSADELDAQLLGIELDDVEGQSPRPQVVGPAPLLDIEAVEGAPSLRSKPTQRPASSATTGMRGVLALRAGLLLSTLE